MLHFPYRTNEKTHEIKTSGHIRFFASRLLRTCSRRWLTSGFKRVISFDFDWWKRQMLRQINMWSAAAPGKLLRLHRTDLHDDGLHRVLIGAFPSVPWNSNSKETLLQPPAVNPIRVCTVTLRCTRNLPWRLRHSCESTCPGLCQRWKTSCHCGFSWSLLQRHREDTERTQRRHSVIDWKYL